MGLFFSSRRRHTRWPRDWSSDVCSSDLRVRPPASLGPGAVLGAFLLGVLAPGTQLRGTVLLLAHVGQDALLLQRSEERRVGKESRCGREDEALIDIEGIRVNKALTIDLY